MVPYDVPDDEKVKVEESKEAQIKHDYDNAYDDSINTTTQPVIYHGIKPNPISILKYINPKKRFNKQLSKPEKDSADDHAEEPTNTFHPTPAP